LISCFSIAPQIIQQGKTTEDHTRIILSVSLLLSGNIKNLKIMKQIKMNIITDYDNLDNEQLEQLRLVHPNGFGDAIVEFTNKRKTVRAIRWETEDKIYLLRLSNQKLMQLMEEEAELGSVNY
jgi:hypothetical protein